MPSIKPSFDVSVYVGTALILRCTWRDEDDALMNPTILEYTIYDDDGVLDTEYTRALGGVTQKSSGVWECRHRFVTQGQYRVVFKGEESSTASYVTRVGEVRAVAP